MHLCRKDTYLKEHGDGLADEVGSTDNDNILARNGNVVLLEQLNAAQRRAGDQWGIDAVAEQQTGVHGMQAVNVLLGGDLLDHADSVEVGRQGKLDEDAIHSGVGVKVGDELLQVLLRDISGQRVRLVEEADLLARLGLHADVRRGVLAVAHDNDVEARGEGALVGAAGEAGALESNDLRGNALANNAGALCTRDKLSSRAQSERHGETGGRTVPIFRVEKSETQTK